MNLRRRMQTIILMSVCFSVFRKTRQLFWRVDRVALHAELNIIKRTLHWQICMTNKANLLEGRIQEY